MLSNVVKCCLLIAKCDVIDTESKVMSNQKKNLSNYVTSKFVNNNDYIMIESHSIFGMSKKQYITIEATPIQVMPKCSAWLVIFSADEFHPRTLPH